MLGTLRLTTQHHSPEDLLLQQHHCVNLQCHRYWCFFAYIICDRSLAHCHWVLSSHCFDSVTVLYRLFSCSSVPIFKNLPEETLAKISDVLEEVSIWFTWFKWSPTYFMSLWGQYSMGCSVERELWFWVVQQWWLCHCQQCYSCQKSDVTTLYVSYTSKILMWKLFVLNNCCNSI